MVEVVERKLEGKATGHHLMVDVDWCPVEGFEWPCTTTLGGHQWAGAVLVSAHIRHHGLPSFTAAEECAY